MTNTCKPSNLMPASLAGLFPPQSYKNNSLHQEAFVSFADFKCLANTQVIQFRKAQHTGFSAVQTDAKATGLHFEVHAGFYMLFYTKRPPSLYSSAKEHYTTMVTIP